MNYALYKVNKGKLDQWRQWCFKLDTKLRAEALKTLEQEGLAFEVFLTFEVNGEWYALGGGLGKSKPSDMSHEINKEHDRQKKECLELLSKGSADYTIHT